MSGLQKNVASQKWIVFAFDRTDNTPKAGDAGNITANLRIDGAGANAVDDANPTELEDGYYYFDLTQAETNGDMILIAPASSTGDIQVIGVPGVIFTVAPNANTLNIANGAVEGDLTYIHGTALTETATQLAGAFVKFFNVSSPTGTVNSLADAVPGAAGGGFIAGTNAAVTITSAAGTALTISSTGSGGHGIDVLGNGAGNGILVTGGGTSGTGIRAVGGITNGQGMEVIGTGTGEGLYAKGGLDNAAGIRAAGGSSNGIGMLIEGDGTAEGMKVIGGDGGGAGFQAIGGTGSGDGFDIQGTGSGVGFKSTGGLTGEGVLITGGATSGSAMKVVANGTNDIGVEIVGIGTGAGVKIDAGATSGIGVDINGVLGGMTINASNGSALLCTATGGNGHGISAVGEGSGDGLNLQAYQSGGTGHGLQALGGNISGEGIRAAATAGKGISALGSGANGHGIYAAGGNPSGAGMYLLGGEEYHGLRCLGGVTEGDGILAAGQTLGDGMTLVATGANQYSLNAGVLYLTQLRINSAAAGGAVDIDNSGGPGVAIYTSSGVGLAIAGSTNGVTIDGNTIALDIGSSFGTTGVRIAGSAGPGVEIDGTTFGIKVAASAGVGLDIAATSGQGLRIVSDHASGAVDIDNSGGPGMVVTSSSGTGLVITGSTNGIDIDGNTIGVDIGASFANTGVRIAGDSGPGVKIDGTTNGMTVGASAGSAVVCTSTGGNGHGLSLVKHGTGSDLDADQVDANVVAFEGHALAGTGTQIADGFEHWFDVAIPAKTMNDAGVAGSGLTATQVWEYAGGRSATVSDKTGFKLASDGVDQIVIEVGTNLRQAVSLIGANCVGKISGAEGTTVVCLGIGVDTTRTTTTTTVDGNRTAVTLARPA